MNLTEHIDDIQQPRSRFTLEHFVIGQHDTPEMRFYQLCLEAQDVRLGLARAENAVARIEARIKRLEKDQPAEWQFDVTDLRLDLEQTTTAMIGARRELAALEDLFSQIPKFTREQIEAAQPEYWRARLTRQVALQVLGTGYVEWAQLDAARQAGILDPAVLNTADREHFLRLLDQPALRAVGP